MNADFIYIVGKADLQASTAHAIHRLGYKAGLLLDMSVTMKDTSAYDRVEFVDFDNLEDEIERLKTLDLKMAGLVCTYENYIVAKALLAVHFNVPSPSVKSAKLSTDKSKMRQAFLAADRSLSPDYTVVDTVDDALEFASQYGYPLIIKPTNLVKSLLVLKCDDEAQLRERFGYAKNTIGSLYKKYNIHGREPQLIIEEFIVGEQYSVAAFVDSSGTPHFCNGVVKLTNAQDIGVDDNYLYSRVLPAELSADIQSEMLRVSEAGVRALDMKSIPAHIELMYGPSGIKIIEIGARIGGYRPRMYNFVYGTDLITQEINVALGKQPSLDGTFASYCAVYELFPDKEGVFDHITGDLDPDQFTYFRVTAKPGDEIGTAKNGYKATAIIIVTSTDKSQFDRQRQLVEAAIVKVHE